MRSRQGKPWAIGAASRSGYEKLNKPLRVRNSEKEDNRILTWGLSPKLRSPKLRVLPQRGRTTFANPLLFIGRKTEA